MKKWEVKKWTESLTIECYTCGHLQGQHTKNTRGNFTPSNCNKCECKEFKFKKEDKGKGIFQKD